MSDEQRVRTEAGWIGVEISRSRVRTPGKPGFGLYRVRGSVGRAWIETRELPRSAVTEDLHGERGPWTEYAFTLEEIQTETEVAISQGTGSRPGSLWLRPAQGGGIVGPVPTRWTSGYRGRRDLGVGAPRCPVDGQWCSTCRIGGGNGEGGTCARLEEPIPVTVKPEWAAKVSALVALVDEGLVAMAHAELCLCNGTRVLDKACVIRTLDRETVRSRQREGNAAFQAEHLKARAVGLERRHAEKARRNERRLREDGGAAR